MARPKQFFKSNTLQTTRVTRVAVVDFILALGAADTHFIGVQHDDIVSGVYVGGILGLMFAAQAMRNLSGETPQSLAIGVYHEPFLHYAIGLCTICFHLFSVAGVILKKEREYYTKDRPISSLQQIICD